MTRMTTVGLLASLILSVAAAPAEAKTIRFQGMHPIPEGQGGGFCYIESPHVHVYEPARPDVLYRPEPDGYAFVGDPVPYGYDGPKYSYYGHHPVFGVHGEEYCYLDGPHYHYAAPPPAERFKLKGGVYFYTGQFPSVYVDAKPRYAKINVVYKPMRYSRPVVVEAPPPEYTGPVYLEERPGAVVVPAQRPVVSGGAAVYGGVGVQAGISLQVGTPVVVESAPAVVVHERPVYVRERPVYVRERPVFIHDHRREVIVVKDHGKHKGWKKWHD